MNIRWGLIAAALIGALAGSAQAQTRAISGTVTDSASGGPLSGAIVTIPGTRIGTYAKDNGRFTITEAPEGEVALLVRLVGYRKREVTVGAGEASVEVTLTRDILKLDEIVVTGQATGVERRNLANAVATITESDLASVPTASVEQQLQGKVAGADIQTNQGSPGGGVQVRLRGVTSINASAEPLYVVDGVIVSDVAIPNNEQVVTKSNKGSNPSPLQQGQVNRIADLSPGDIENIEILKGASASAIYGGRASNGVVIISTKRGRVGSPQVNVTHRFGFFALSNKLGARRFDSTSAVGVFGATAAPFFANGAQPFFDHEQQLAGRKALSYETSASISGGDDNTRYFASGITKNDEGIIQNTGFQRQGVRVNLDQRLGARIRTSVNTNVIHTKAQRGLTGNTNDEDAAYYVALAFTPAFADLTPDATGVFRDNPFEKSNPLQTAALSKNDEDVWRFLASSRLQWDAVQTGSHYFRVITDGGLDFFTQENSLFFPPELQLERNLPQPGRALLSESNNVNLNLNGNLVHTYTPAGRRFSATTSAGIQYARRRLNISRIVGTGLVGGQSNVDASITRDVAQNRQLIKNLGYFLQEEVLTAGEKLLLTAGIRADQSSLDADSKKLFWYPKLAASYRVVKPASFLDEIKFRGAYGASGNEPEYGQRFSPLTATGNIGGAPGLVVGGTRGASDLRPERQREFEGGFDAYLWGNTANLEFTIYQKNISDLLLPRTLAPSSGFTTEIANGGKLRTRGVEISGAVQPVQGPLTWLSRVTFFSNRSKVTELPIPAFLSTAGGFGVGLGAYRIEEGQSPTQLVGNDTLANGSSVVRKIGDANPDFKMSFTNDLTYKAFGLHFLLDWQKGSTILNLTKLLSDLVQNTADFADPIPGSTLTVGQKRFAGLGVTAANYVESASFLKLREVTLSYDLPISAVRSLWRGARSARLSLSARNLFSSSPYTGLDPEVSNFGNQAIVRNIDVGPFPPSRSFWFAIDLGL